MKKLKTNKLIMSALLVLSLAIAVKMSYAACIGGGRFCFDDKGASINGNSFDGNGYVIPVLSSTTINANTPNNVGQIVGCNNCNKNGGGAANFGVCIASATDSGSWVLVSSTSLRCN